MLELRHAARLGEDIFGRAALLRWGLRWMTGRWSAALWGLSSWSLPRSLSSATADDSRHSRDLNRHAFHRDGDRHTDGPLSIPIGQ